MSPPRAALWLTTAKVTLECPPQRPAFGSIPLLISPKQGIPFLGHSPPSSCFTALKLDSTEPLHTDLLNPQYPPRSTGSLEKALLSATACSLRLPNGLLKKSLTICLCRPIPYLDRAPTPSRTGHCMWASAISVIPCTFLEQACSPPSHRHWAALSGAWQESGHSPLSLTYPGLPLLKTQGLQCRCLLSPGPAVTNANPQPLANEGGTLMAFVFHSLPPSHGVSGT